MTFEETHDVLKDKENGTQGKNPPAFEWCLSCLHPLNQRMTDQVVFLNHHNLSYGDNNHDTPHVCLYVFIKSKNTQRVYREREREREREIMQQFSWNSSKISEQKRVIIRVEGGKRGLISMWGYHQNDDQGWKSLSPHLHFHERR